MNLRCTHDPGCPVWLEPYKTEEVLAKQEQSVIGKVWNELFPEDVLPEVLAQPCCAQFGVSRPAITRLRIERWILWRDWIMMTPLTDYFSGRIWEFLWQFILSGNPISCPEESSCYCDGYGLCFGGPQAYSEFEKLHKARLEAAKELEVAEINSHGVHDVEHLKERLEALATEEKKLIEEALERGNDPVARAEELTGEDEL